MVRSAPDGSTRPEGSSAPLEGEAERLERELGPSEGAPPFAQPYLGYFTDLRATISLQEGFVLAPVEVPSMDVGRELCASFERAGMRVVRVEVKPGEGQDLAMTLLSVPASKVDLVVVLGPRDVTDDVREGLNRLNLQRDTLAARIGKTLVWCGLRSFLNATWEEAPDFWSIRDVTFRIPLASTRGVERHALPLMAGLSTVDVDEALRAIEMARKVGDERNLVRSLIRYAEVSLWQGKAHEAEACQAEAAAIIERQASFQGTREAARCEELRGDVDFILHGPHAGIAAYTRALSLYTTLDLAQDRGRLLHKRAMWSNDVEQAEQDIEQSLKLSIQAGDSLDQATALLIRGDLRQQRGDLDGARLDYEDALHLFKELGQHLGQANVLLARGDLRRQKDDLDGALLDYEKALHLYKQVDSRLGEALVLKARSDLEIARKTPAALPPTKPGADSSG